jgi:hypothetical protein
VTGQAETGQEQLLEEIDNPIERLKLLSGNDDEIAKYLDAIEVTSPREREMMQEISRTRPLARPDLFPQAHRNMVEALESLARHGYHGTGAGKRRGHCGPQSAGASSSSPATSSCRTFGTSRPGSGTSTASARSKPCRAVRSASCCGGRASMPNEWSMPCRPESWRCRHS